MNSRISNIKPEKKTMLATSVDAAVSVVPFVIIAFREVAFRFGYCLFCLIFSWFSYLEL